MRCGQAIQRFPFVLRAIPRPIRHGRLVFLAVRLILCIWSAMSNGDAWCQDQPAAHQARVESDGLRVVIADNESYPPDHKAGYNGVAELRLQEWNRSNLFVPSYAGLNLEHIFNGDADSNDWDIFEPRRAALKLQATSAHRVELHQERTAHWPLRSRIVYEVHGHAIDMTYYGTPLEDAWKKHGYIGVFFASYIQSPDDKAIQFIGRSRPGLGDPAPRWIRHLPDRHGEAASHRPAGSTWDPTFDDGFKIGLASGFSDLEYVYPFYFGRSGENVFIMMFDDPQTGNEMRFAQSPSGGGNGNPAWDFVYFQRDYAVAREFHFRARAVYQKFTTVDDIVRLYELWSGKKVHIRSP